MRKRSDGNAHFRTGLSNSAGGTDKTFALNIVGPAAIQIAYQSHAAELVGLAAYVILANATPVLAAVRAQTHTIPIVFVQVIDPVSRGFVNSLPRPGGNITGFTNFEFPMG